MSKLYEIKGKKVDYKVLSSNDEAANSINSGEDHGKINVVIDDNSEDVVTALYVGNQHIADGYGFNSIEEINKAKQIINHPAIEKLLNKAAEDTEIEDEERIKVEESSVSFKNITLSINDEGHLEAETFIDIYNVELTLSDNTKIYEGDNKHITMFDDLSIIKIDFDYDLISDKNISYKLEFISNGTTIDSTNFETITDLLNTTIETQIDDSPETIELIPGLSHHVSLNVSKELIKDIEHLNYLIRIILTDSYLGNTSDPRYIIKNICNVYIEYPIFISNVDVFQNGYTEYNGYTNNEITLYNINTDETVNLNSDIYDKLHGTELSLSNSLALEENYTYIFLPEIIKNPTFIYKKSNIACDFIKKTGSGRNIIGGDDNSHYDVYCSPHKYIGGLTWIIK